MRILVTGSLGFIATNLILYLKNHFDCSIVGIDSGASLSTNQQFTSALAEHHIVDLSDVKCFSQVNGHFDFIIHLAALGNVVESVSSPRLNFNANVVTTLNLLDWMRKSGNTRLLFSSTGGALMGNTSPPVNEASLPSPISPYGASKLACEGYLSAYAKSYGIEYMIFRFGNVFGPYSCHKKGVINNWISRMLSHEDIPIYGDGSSTRDYIFVQDICSGIALGIGKFANIDRCKNTFHLATSRQTSLNKLFDMLVDITGSSSSLVHLPNRSGEVYQNSSSYALAHEILGFKPTIALYNNLLSTFEWLKIHQN